LSTSTTARFSSRSASATSSSTSSPASTTCLAGTRIGPRKGPSTLSSSRTTGAACSTSSRACPWATNCGLSPRCTHGALHEPYFSTIICLAFRSALFQFGIIPPALVCIMGSESGGLAEVSYYFSRLWSITLSEAEGTSPAVYPCADCFPFLRVVQCLPFSSCVV
jgi:hypothetical protein